NLVAGTGANVLSVLHNRSTADLPIGYANVELELETVNEEHVEKIKQLLSFENYNYKLL
ncbi:MAG TPA: threonine ammonia-lyase, partial [Thermoanaerobacterales bacterium]|nr:threonine ammonia-lyase [Thermoanaerobacterales bacterium]